MKIKKTYVGLLTIILFILIALLLSVNNINIVQFIGYSMVLSLFWGILWANILININGHSIKNKVLKTLLLLVPNVLFIVLFYGVLWHYLPMQTIENNTHFGPTESLTFNSTISLGTYLANTVQQIVITIVFYFIIKFIRKLKH